MSHILKAVIKWGDVRVISRARHDAIFPSKPQKVYSYWSRYVERYGLVAVQSPRNRQCNFDEEVYQGSNSAEDLLSPDLTSSLLVMPTFDGTHPRQQLKILDCSLCGC
ncbi:uncharacterized protein LOC106669168 [Cimex lectularius]|uniref:Uncharacterized protein n=1 Tax=Cimex lectularius TaxID=79782 RepID=A0A8I6SSR3_CIMLE|nr:uncharacterized protein LOC106669168 [Cimex lectularius]